VYFTTTRAARLCCPRQLANACAFTFEIADRWIELRWRNLHERNGIRIVLRIFNREPSGMAHAAESSASGNNNNTTLFQEDDLVASRCSVRDLPLPRAIAKPELRSELIIYMLLRLTFLPMLNFECDH
jgi:hypothetical protein